MSRAWDDPGGWIWQKVDWMLLFKTRLRWWQWAVGVGLGLGLVVLAIALERGLGPASFRQGGLSSDPEVLRSEIEAMLTFTHTEERPDDYLGPDRTLITQYAARLEDCWLTVTITRPDEAFCRVSESRTRTKIIENNLRFSDRVEVPPTRTGQLLDLRPQPNGVPNPAAGDLASRHTRTKCSGDQTFREDSRHLESIWFPVNSIDDVPERLVAYRRAICPTVLDYLRFLRP